MVSLKPACNKELSELACGSWAFHAQEQRSATGWGRGRDMGNHSFGRRLKCLFYTRDLGTQDNDNEIMLQALMLLLSIACPNA